MKLKVLVGLLVFLVVLNLAALGTFMYGHLSRPPRPPMHFISEESPGRGAPHAERPWLRHLPPRERGELFELLQEFQHETHDLRMRAHVLEGEAFDLMQLDPVPTARVDSLLGEISAARLEISRIAARKLIEAKTVLPPEEQRMFFDAILGARPTPGAGHEPPRGERRFKGHSGRANPDTL